jgi:hypothetical protein
MGSTPQRWSFFNVDRANENETSKLGGPEGAIDPGRHGAPTRQIAAGCSAVGCGEKVLGRFGRPGMK